MLRVLLPLLLALAAACPAGAQPAAPDGAPGDPSPHSAAELVAPAASIRPGQPFEVALRLTTDPGWHVYWTNPGDSGMPPSLAWQSPPGFTPGALRFPFPERILLPPLASYGYEGEVFFPIAVQAPAAPAMGEVTLRAKAEWLVCADVCLPAEQDVALTLPVGAGAPAPHPAWGARIDAARDRLPAEMPGWSAAAARAGGGYALTLTPPPGWAGEPAGAYFFADTGGVVQHAAEQAVERTADGFRLAIPESEFASAPVARLTGVLVAPEGTGWDGAGRRALAVDVPVEGVTAAGAASTIGPPPPANEVSSVWVALLFAFGGGLILNLMPCVFPLLSIKILGFAQGREGRGGDLRLHGLLFGAGVLVSFWAVAGLLLVLRAAGQGVAWGYLLQLPGFVAGLALLMFVLALNLGGLFEVGLGLAGFGGRLDRKTGLGGAFLSGVLATVVATPCTAPFMGAALGFAMVRPPAVALLVFTALGVGMALPYVLLSTFPRWLERLPRPGAWMQTLKQALAFPLFATTVWLVWVFGGQTGMNGAALLLFALLLVALAGWLVGRWDRLRISRGQHVLTRALAAVAAGLAVYIVVLGSAMAPSAAAAGAPAGAAGSAAGWRPFEPAAVEALVAEGRPVFVDFTADWCLSCQANKLVALHTDAVEEAFRARGVATFRADWTSRDPVITEALARFGRAGVPVYALYPGGGSAPVLLPELLTPAIVLDALDQVTGSELRVAR
jgi:thiol:disulfide interchange protein/DsbC/DsbD-like thiol-disulfide interchange protein